MKRKEKFSDSDKFYNRNTYLDTVGHALIKCRKKMQFNLWQSVIRRIICVFDISFGRVDPFEEKCVSRDDQWC